MSFCGLSLIRKFATKPDITMTIDELRSAAAVVRDATEEGENTATRIGQLFLDTVNTLCNVSTNAIKGYVVISSTSDLPTSPTTEQQMKGYLLGTVLYVWVGTGGDTLGGKYQSAQLKGADGAPGEKGDKGESGVHLGDVALVNDLTEGGEESALSAEMGKVLNIKIADYGNNIRDVEETLYVNTVADSPIVEVSTLSANKFVCKAGSSDTASFSVSGKNLTGDIIISVVGSTKFSVSPASISPTNGAVASTLVTITYAPASGTADFTQHSCKIKVSSANETFGEFSLHGMSVSAPTVVIDPSSLSIEAVSGSSATGTINVKGYALEGDVSLAVSGTGFSLSSASVSQTDAESASGKDITVTFSGSSDSTATITASSTNATNTTTLVSAEVFTPLAIGCYWDVPNEGGGALRYTVIDTGEVSVKGASYNSVPPKSSLDNPLVIPAFINDSDYTVYDSGGDEVTSSGMTYKVTTIAEFGFSNLLGTNLKSIVLSEGITTIGSKAFAMTGNYASDSKINIQKISFPSTLTSIGTGNAYTFQNNRYLTAIEFRSDVAIPAYAFYSCVRIALVKLCGNVVKNNAFSGCTQFSGSASFTPVVVNYEATPYNYRTYSFDRPFPESSNGEVTATLYCPNVPGYRTKGWGVFQIAEDISNIDN